MRNYVTENYINKENWKIDAIYKASGAAGPLAQWVESQLKYASIL